MALEKRPIPFDEFARDVAGFFERVIREHDTLLVEKTEGEIVMVKAAPSRKSTKVPRSRKPLITRDAFLSSAGGWKDLVDTDKLVESIYESRSITFRPPVQL